MAVSKERMDFIKEYNKEHYSRIGIYVSNERKEQINDAANKNNMSVNNFINTAIDHELNENHNTGGTNMLTEDMLYTQLFTLDEYDTLLHLARKEKKTVSKYIHDKMMEIAEPAPVKKKNLNSRLLDFDDDPEDTPRNVNFDF